MNEQLKETLNKCCKLGPIERTELVEELSQRILQMVFVGGMSKCVSPQIMNSIPAALCWSAVAGAKCSRKMSEHKKRFAYNVIKARLCNNVSYSMLQTEVDNYLNKDFEYAMRNLKNYITELKSSFGICQETLSVLNDIALLIATFATVDGDYTQDDLNAVLSVLKCIG